MRTIEDYGMLARLLKLLYTQDIVISPASDDLRQILQTYPKLVIASNHGPIWGAMAGVIGLAEAFRAHGGGKRRPFGITWRAFYNLPVARQLSQYFTQAGHPQHFEDALRKLTSGSYDDCVIMPEGENCNFGNGFDIQPFLSPRFVELALRVQVPILVMVHQGSERWAWTTHVPEPLMPFAALLPHNMAERLQASRTLSIPKLIKPRLPRLELAFRLYKPNINLGSLAEDEATRHRQLEAEAENVRVLMEDLVRTLAHESAQRSQST